MTEITGIMNQLVALLHKVEQEAVIVAAAAAVGYVTAAVLDRRSSALRLPIGASVALAGLLWVGAHYRLGASDTMLLGGVMFGVWWALGIAHLVAQLGHRLIKRMRQPWRSDQGGVVSQQGFESRLDREVSRISQGSGPGLVVLAIDTELRGWSRRRTLREAWRRARRIARLHDTLHRCDDGSILALLPDTAGRELASWIEELKEPLVDALIGQAQYPADGRTLDALVDGARARTRGQPSEAAAPWASTPVSPERADPSCIQLSDDDVICVDGSVKLPLGSVAR